MASDGEALTGLWFEGQKYFAAGVVDKNDEKQLPIFDLTAKWLRIYFSGQEPDFLPVLKPEGTKFRRLVWDILLAIPYGKTLTYGEIAKDVAARMGIPRMSAQAVGGAVGHNPISLIIPCHRVVGADGSLTGYAGGIDKKRKLLMIESKAYGIVHE